MPRAARIKSSTDIYHVMLRGINRQTIFEDDRDYRKFLAILSKCKNISGCRIYAYCLMYNHVHLLIKTEDEPLELFIKRIGCRYVRWFNKKYDRVGHLFQNRYKSVTVESERSFLSVLRYIIQNPLKAGLENAPGTYAWTSYRDYFSEGETLTDRAFPLRLIGSREEMFHFLQEETLEVLGEPDESDTLVRQARSKQAFCRLTGCRSTSDFQKSPPEEQQKFIFILYENHISMGRIAMLTGKSKATVYRIIRKQKAK